MITVNNLSFNFGGQLLFKDVNLKFNKGITVITGQNGSGKSSLIKLIMDINKSNDGKIIFNKKGD